MEQPYLAECLAKFDFLPPNQDTTVLQEKLNLQTKLRTSLFPWRGQFSPELVELLLDKYSHFGDVVFDPFAGSGTTLFECSRKNLSCYGTEINPAAIEMANTIYFVHSSHITRETTVRKARWVVESHFEFEEQNLFNYQNYDYSTQQSTMLLERRFNLILDQSKDDILVRNLLVNAMIRYMSSLKNKGVQAFRQALWEHTQIIDKLPYNQKSYQLFQTDARCVPLPDKSIDLVITSPPYINVFNYHQNNRPAMELMGWNLLNVAKSEIGSNRKNRHNRFLTVVQYALDMVKVLGELKRLITSSGRVIIIIGRKSNIRGVSFKNSALFTAIALAGTGFSLLERQERQFKNRFGQIIHEDILHFVPTSEPLATREANARLLARLNLIEAAKSAPQPVRFEIEAAIKSLEEVKASPMFNLQSSRILTTMNLASEQTLKLAHKVQ